MSGGRWKPLHYLLKRSLLTDAFGVCGEDARCIFKNDGALLPLEGTATLSLLHVATGASSVLLTHPLSLARGAGAAEWICADGSAVNYSAPLTAPPCPPWSALLPPQGCAASGADCVLIVTIASPALAAPYENVVLLAPPVAMLPLPPANVTAVVAARVNADGSANVTVASDATALFVTLVTLAQGRFDDNAFLLPAGAVPRVLRFLPVGGAGAVADIGLLASSLRVDHIALYVSG